MLRSCQSALANIYTIPLLFLNSQQTLGHSQIVDRLSDSEQRSNHNHSAQTALEESGGSLVLQRLTADKRAVINWRISTHGTATHVMQSDMPLNSFSPSAFLIACRRVLTTSNGLTARAAVEPAAKPARKEHLKNLYL